jgi:hypothetical protein
MTLLQFNGFEGYTDPYDQRDASDFITSIQKNNTVYSTGRNGGNSLKYDDDAFSGNYVYFSFPSIDNTKQAIMGMAVKFGNLSKTANSVIAFAEAMGAYAGFEADLVGNGDLRLKIKYYNTSLASYDLPLTANQWYYIEAQVSVRDTLGVGIIRVNEQEVVNFSGDTKSPIAASSTIQFFRLQMPFGSKMEVDDIYIADNQGSENNDFLGDIRIDAIHPNGAGNYSQFTPSAGNNYECVGETELDESDYVSHLTTGEKDSYTYGSVPTDLDDAGIIGLQIRNNAQRTAAATNIKIDPFIRTGSTDYSQTAYDLPDAIGMVETDIIIDDPSDSNPWTQARINACEFGMEVG